MLNPTGGVKGQPLHSKLDFEKDETRPGGGVFVVRGELNEKDVDKLPKGTIVAGEVGKRGDEGEAPRTVSSASRSSIANDASSSSAPLSPTRTAPPPHRSSSYHGEDVFGPLGGYAGGLGRRDVGAIGDGRKKLSPTFDGMVGLLYADCMRAYTHPVFPL